VESPGTAPGSDPIITSAFMSIVPKDKKKVAFDSVNYKTSHWQIRSGSTHAPKPIDYPKHAKKTR